MTYSESFSPAAPDLSAKTSRHQVLVRGLSPEEACIVGVDAVNESSSELTAMLDDKGVVWFQTIEQFLTPQNDNKGTVEC